MSTFNITDCIFCVDAEACGEEGESPSFIITPRAVFDERGCCDDCFDKCTGLPLGFANEAESQWGFYRGTVEQGMKLLQAAGCEYSEPLSDFINP